MRCVIPGRSVKLFAKSIYCLSKIGDELYLEALPQGLALRTVNSSRSAYACFMFHTSFFMSYDDGSKDLPEDSEADDLVKCKIAMKSCLSAFKSMSTIEKSVDRCKIELDMREARLVFLLYCRHGITKTHNLTFQECETLQAVFSKDLCPNFITSQVRILSDTVYNFPNNQEELTLMVCPEKLKAKNYVEDEPDPNKVIHTEMTLVPEEFDNYQIGVDTEVTFCLKELRGILSFAEYVNQPINLHFETGGKPLVFSMDADPTYDADFVLATLAEQQQQQSSSQAASQMSTEPVTNKPTAKRGKAKQTNSTQGSATAVKKSKKMDKNEGQAAMVKQKEEAKTSVSQRQNSHDKSRTTHSQQQHTSSVDNNMAATGSGRSVERKAERPRTLDTNTNAADIDDFFGDSFPYQDLFIKKDNKDLSAIPENSLENRETSQDRSARPIDTPPSSVTDVSFMKNVDMPSLGDSCASPGNVDQRSKQRELAESMIECMDDDDDEFVPSTPPSKKFKSMFFSSVPANKIEVRDQGVVLAADTDESD